MIRWVFLSLVICLVIYIVAPYFAKWWGGFIGYFSKPYNEDVKPKEEQKDA